ncbi:MULTISPECIES: GGDEF domain-containing protein [Pseudomonas]|jgi:diguanylate cyclase (GGDEF)-like protein|uniref:diguanylate cyclase n=1 Tax=Pseudomonas lutea TaxID=243924 RepID=A0ABR9A7D8_9PSED|nr:MULTISPECIES: GGDEF domain-containing protein [Pseudomonas]MBD8121475.1 GGDEF domain-containing protein [Pseudomonas lutea]
MLSFVLDRPGPNDAQVLAEVDRTIASRFRGLRFSAELESRYEAETLEQRRRFLTAVGITGGIIYNVFMVSDWLSLNDMFAYVALGRVFLITPLFIFLTVIVLRAKTRAVVEAAAGTGTVLCSLMPLVVMIFSESPFRLHYQLGMLLIMVYCTVIQQLPVRYSAVAMAFMLTFQLVTTYIADFADFQIWQANALLFVSTVALLLMASWFLEHGSRLSYLFALRGRLLQKQLLELARIDSLTQLFNRRFQGEVLASLWSRAAEVPMNVAVILLDIDHFKSYNDNYGHLQGDTCLRLLSGVIQRTANKADALTFRFGGEEILVLMTHAHPAQARALAENLRSAVSALNVPHPALGAGAKVTISLGVAVANAPQISAEALIAMADKALYAAKREGRDCLRCAPAEVA